MNLTTGEAPKLEPLIVTLELIGPEDGLKELIVGPAGNVVPEIVKLSILQVPVDATVPLLIETVSLTRSLIVMVLLLLSSEIELKS